MSLVIAPASMPVEPPRPEVEIPTDPPKLLWPSISYTNHRVSIEDRTSFPNSWQIGDRRKRKREVVLALEAFQFAVLLAEVRVLVLDPHFDEAGVEALAPALDGNRSVRDVRLLTGTGDIATDSREDARRDLTKATNADRTQSDGLVAVAWRAALNKRKFPFLHDRFAIVDGALWHFGSTVGGGFCGMTAASGPWPASDTRAVDFFNECWRCHA